MVDVDAQTLIIIVVKSCCNGVDYLKAHHIQYAVAHYNLHILLQDNLGSQCRFSSMSYLLPL